MVQFTILPGLVRYQDALVLMENHVDKLISNTAREVVYLLEHQDVYTSGTSAKVDELLDTADVEVVHTGRGGRVTFHGPGQRVIYPMLDLSARHRNKDLRLYINTLEQWLINSLFKIGVDAYVMSGRVGIWVTEAGASAKIAAIGVRVRKWVTYHGVALNVSTDLSKFQSIVPCGLYNCPITSLRKLGVDITMQQFDAILQSEFNKLFCDISYS